MIFKFFLLFLTVHTLNAAIVPNGKDVERLGQLYATSLIFRHGDRNPTMQYPGDIYNISYWPEGWGQLTTLGKQQQYALGRWSRARYQNLLSTSFHANDVYVRSSDVDRTLMSAMSNLAGLYPPTDKQAWNKAIPWQPIPVHTVPKSMDYITGEALPPCKAFEQANKAYLQSDEMKKFDASIQPIYDYLTASLGTPIKDVMTVLLIRDALYIHSVYNLTLPAWSKSIFPDDQKFYDASLKYYYADSSTNFLAKFRSGFLLKDILDRFTAKVAKTLSPDLKYYAYSTHDTVLANFLNSLGVYDFKFVPYAAAIILELRFYQNEFWVQLFYKNSDKTPEPINIPQCGTACPLSKMYQVYAQILPQNDFNTECSIGV